MPRLVLSTLAFVLGLTVLVPTVSAAVSREQAADLAQRKVPGRVLKVERGLHVDNSVIWRIQLLTTAGEVRLVILDAETGRVR